MSDLAKVFGQDKTIEHRLHALRDLSQFGIHIDNPCGQCCVCGEATAGFTEGVTADDLCRQCAWSIKPDRWEGEFYTNETVLVSYPFIYRSNVRVIWDGQDLSGGTSVERLGLVAIDGRLYLLREGFASSSTHLIDPTTLQIVRPHGLHIAPRRLFEKLFLTQEPLR